MHLSANSSPGRQGVAGQKVAVDVSYATPVVELSRPGRRAWCRALLSEADRTRLDRLRIPGAHDLFLTAHALVRLSLSRLERVDPADWQFSPDIHGRPQIIGPITTLKFSLSHTRNLACCAITSGHEVGIDAEDISRPRPTGLAERFFSAEECRHLRGLPADDQPAHFFQCWTLKEAYAKARGAQLLVSLKSCGFSRSGQTEWRLECDRACDPQPERWRFQSWRVGDRHQVSLAVAMPSGALPEASVDVQHFTGDITRAG
jgi:4'-phosphopantetheinyl transferase